MLSSLKVKYQREIMSSDFLLTQVSGLQQQSSKSTSNVIDWKITVISATSTLTARDRKSKSGTGHKIQDFLEYRRTFLPTVCNAVMGEQPYVLSNQAVLE